MADAQKHINYSYADIEKYLNGRMNATEMYAFEKAALTDAFLADAIEGFKESDAATTNKHLQQIEQAIRGEQTQARVVVIPVKKNTGWRVAAVAIALVGIGGISYLMLNTKPTQQNTIAKTETIKADNTVVKPIVPPAIKEESKQVFASAKPLYKKSNPKKQPEFDTYKKDAKIKEEENIASTIMYQNDSIVANAKLDDVVVVGYGRQQKKDVTGAVTQPMPVAENKSATVNQALAGRVAGVQSKNFIINGKVLNNAGMPLSNASVYVPDKRIAAITNSNGEFTLSLKDSVAKVSINSIGMQSANATVYSNQNNNIRLNENNQSLSEVVVTEMGKRKKEKPASAYEVMKQNTKIDSIVPEGGWDNFKVYVKNKLSSSFSEDELDAEIEFDLMLDKKGNVKDVDITKSSNEKINTSVADAIKQGPKWIDKSSKKKEKKRAVIKL